MQHAAASIAIVLLCSCSKQVPPLQPAPPPDGTVFGIIKLGEPLPSLPACDDPAPIEPCDQSSLFADEPTRIYIPALQATDRYSMVVVCEEIDNKVERVWIKSTKRIGADREILTDLQSKYGTPSYTHRNPNTSGDIVVWELDGLEVTWWARDLEERHGSALIQTTRGREYANEQRRQQEAATPRL